MKDNKDLQPTLSNKYKHIQQQQKTVKVHAKTYYLGGTTKKEEEQHISSML